MDISEPRFFEAVGFALQFNSNKTMMSDLYIPLALSIYNCRESYDDALTDFPCPKI